jgi:NAD(P)-dependent dehydrogenase (short-subunit alcohol dehydrogenase family)
MDLQLTNKKALVTGSTAGIGFAIASLLAHEGASVVVNGRSRQRVEQGVGVTLVGGSGVHLGDFAGQDANLDTRSS